MNTSVPASELLVEVRGPVLWITINREPRRNALNGAVIAGIHAAVRDLAHRAAEGSPPRVRALVLTGAGRRAFCAGADLTGGPGVFADTLSEPSTDFGRLARTFRELGIPSIARVNGDCVAGGMGLMALCDLAVVADHARFGLPEARVGVFPMQVLVYLRRLVHARHVNELCLTGELIDSARALEMGIANQVVSYSDLDAAVTALLNRLLALSPLALKRGKYAIAAMESMAFSEALAFAEAQITIASRTEDAQEGLAAFNEKRKPRWTDSTDET
jgi:enoyl-CoA hydratase/carnithine racemase